MRRPAIFSLLALAGTVAAIAAGVAPAAQSRRGDVTALTRTRQQAALATARAAGLEVAAAAAVREAERARAEQAAVAAQVAAAEADITAARARIHVIEGLQRQQQQRLGAQQRPIVRLTAALAGMARRPGALALVQPGSLTDAVHVSAVLASSLPLVQARTAGIRAEIAEGDRLRAGVALALATLRAGEQRLRAQRAELARLEARHRERSLRLADSAFAEQDRAMTLGEQARDIVDQMAEMETKAEIRARLVALPAPLPRPAVAGGSPREPAPPTPPGGYRLPARGPLLTGFGEVFESGVRAGGLTIAAPAGSPVVAPAAGTVAYAAPFRSYGRIVIIDHGSGWLSLLAGMAPDGVAQGSQVAAGDVVGVVRDGNRGVTVELRHDGGSVDIAALLGRG
jgi:septal ring factor EnvC (AmiA/AmiB activator)